VSELMPVVIIQGPTASGKSALAVDLAYALNGVVINGDSMQMYSHLKVLTARPSADDEKRVPHRLFGVIDPAQQFSVGAWLDLVSGPIDDARINHQLPIVVGGTGMYLKCLMQGLAQVPSIDPQQIVKSENRYEKVGGVEFQKTLAQHDVSVLKLDANDRQRLIRADSVFHGTGRTLNDWQNSNHQPSPVKGPFIIIRILPDREPLYHAINRRFEKMMTMGALGEVKKLLALNLDKNLPVMKALGVDELFRFIKGDLSQCEAIDLARQKSRQYAKRQMTWLRNQITPDLDLTNRYDGHDLRRVTDYIKNIIPN